MILDFFEHQLDYIFFFYGLVFILLGAICVIIRRDTISRLPWIWLGFFGFTHGVNEWLDMIALSVPDSIFFSYLRIWVIAVSFFFLIEFGRRGVARSGGPKTGVWIYIPIGICIAAGYLGGFASLNGSIRYVMGLTGGLWAAWALWRASANPTFRRIFRYAALLTALYAVATGFIVPESPVLLAQVINYTSFFELTGLPVQLARGLLIILLIVTLWHYYQTLRQLMLLRAEIPADTTNREGIWISITLVFIIFGGWFFTEYTGKHEENDLKNEVIKQGVILSASLHPEHISPLLGDVADTKLIDYIHLREQFVDTIDSSPHIRWIKLVLIRDNQYVFETFDGIATIDKSDSYKRYTAELSGVFYGGETFAIGPYRDNQGSFLSAFVPVYNHDNGSIIAALVIDVDALPWEQKIAAHRIMPILIVLLVSIILISFFVIRQRLLESAQTIERDEARLEEAQHIAHSGSWSWNIKTNELDWSNEIYHIFGLDPKISDLNYNIFIGMVHPDDREMVKQAVYEALYNASHYNLEHRIVLPGGATKVIYGKGKIKYDQDKNPIQLIGTMQDITEQKLYEQQLKEANATKDKFFSIIAHDLKNPFNALLGFSEMLHDNIDEMDRDEIKKTVEIVYQNSQNAYTLIEDLLQWSRAQTGRLEYRPERFDLGPIVGESLAIVRGQADNKEIRLVDNTEPIAVFADRNLLKTILRNLLSNAIKYTNSGGTITVGAVLNGDMAEISVADTGVGIPPEAIDKLFRIDTKYSTPGTAKEVGTGLGLILCREFVGRHGGKIWVESPGDGKGTTFMFTLPAGHNG